MSSYDYGSSIKEYITAINNYYSNRQTRSNHQEIIELLDILYSITRSQIHDTLIPKRSIKGEKEIRNIVKSIITKILPIIENKITYLANNLSNKVNKEYIKEFTRLYDDFMSIASFRSFKHFCLYMDFEKNRDDKVWMYSSRSMAGLLYYTNKMILDDDVNLIRLSCPTGYGKTYSQNATCAFYFGVNPSIRILRVTESIHLVKRCTQDTKAIMASKMYRKAFPVFDKENIYRNNDSESFNLIASEKNGSYLCVTRESMANGVRADVIMLDDLSKGYSESANPNVHEKIVNTAYTIWFKRVDNEKKTKILISGTMWADFDLLNVVRKNIEDYQEIQEDDVFQYTEISEDKSKVFIGVPSLDFDTDQSTLPEKFSTEQFKRERNIMPVELWAAMAQQRPLPPKDLSFDWSQLKTYDEIPKDENGDSKLNYINYASLDPARKGKNYVSMPIFNEIDDVYYLIDCLYEKKGMEELYNPICQKIIQHNVVKLYLENNIDTSLKRVLLDMLAKLGWHNTEIVEKYATANKEQRIKDLQGSIKANIRFPSRAIVSPATQMGMFMKHLTQFNFDRPNAYDDSVDSVALFIKEHIFVKNKFKKAKAIDRRI